MGELGVSAQALPDTEAEVLSRLRELEAELKPLAEQKRKIDARAYRCCHIYSNMANPTALA